MKPRRQMLSIIAFLGLAATAAVAQPAGVALVGINDRAQSEGVDEFVVFDPGTGVGTAVGSLGDMFVNCEALTASLPFLPPDAKLETPQNNNPVILTVDEHRLVRIDQFTGAGIEVLDLGFSDVDGIYFLGSDVYGVTYGTNKIIRVTGFPTPQVSVVANDVLQGHRLNDIAFNVVFVTKAGSDPAVRGFFLPNAFIITDDVPTRIYEVDVETGEKVRRWVIQGPTSMESLVPVAFPGVSPTGVPTLDFYSAADRDGYKDLVRIQLANDASEAGWATFLSDQHSGFRDIEGLAWLSQPSLDALAGVLNGATDAVPGARHLGLQQNAPNPFNPSTRIVFDLERTSPVDLSIYDAAGHKVITLVQGLSTAGRHEVVWQGLSGSGRSVAGGVYRYTLSGPGWRESRSMVLVK